MFEAVAIRKCGYPFRLRHKEFMYRCRGCSNREAAPTALSASAADHLPSSLRYRYRCLVPKDQRKSYQWTEAAAIATCKKMMQSLPTSAAFVAAGVAGTADFKDVKVGKTMVFYR